MRIVFFGSAEIGFPSLERLLASSQDQLVAVVTQPDRPAGRKQLLTPCPVKDFALRRGVPVFSPEKVKESLPDLTALQPDLFVVVAYGQYIPQSVLKVPPHGAINLHPSLLPRYRGSSPIQWALANGDRVTGVSIMVVSDRMDAGDILLQRELAVGDEDTTETLEPVLAELGAGMLIETIDQIRNGTVRRIPQNEAEAVEIRKLTKEDGRIDWRLPADAIRNRIRGFLPWPGCFCETADGLRIKVLRASVENCTGSPGEILDVTGPGLLVAAGERSLRLLEVQPAGKNRMDGASFLRGHAFPAGARLQL